ncbi:MAG: hypothetical protein MJ192_06700 [Clostridia bacterium]|nr:hypothetical protein [Clostridia bacterium]
MIFPTINDLSQDKYNRYEIALAAAKCARLVTNEYVHQRTEAEASQTGNKETDKPLQSLIDKDLRDEKAVKIAVGRLYNHEYVITTMSPEEQQKVEQAILEGPHHEEDDIPEDLEDEDEDEDEDEEDAEDEAGLPDAEADPADAD